jgi:hypothetical protein
MLLASQCSKLTVSSPSTVMHNSKMRLTNTTSRSWQPRSQPIPQKLYYPKPNAGPPRRRRSRHTRALVCQVQRQRRNRQRVPSVVFVHQNRRQNELSRPCGCSYVQEYLQVLEQAMIMPVWRFGAECGAFRPKNNLLRPIYSSLPHLIFPPPFLPSVSPPSKNTAKNIQQRVFASGHPPDY